MKKALRLSALLLICFFAFVSCTQDPVYVTITPTIRGKVSIPSGANVKGSDFYIRIMEGENAVYTGKVKEDGSFAVEGLDETKTYSILLSTEELGEVNTSARDVSRAASTSGYGGWLKNVTASVNEQAGVGSIKVKPLGTIKGVVKRSGEEEHSDIMVYIPGTSYMAVTDSNGNYSIFNVPQSSSTYNLRCISVTGDWLPEVITGVLLYSDSDTENPVKTVPERSIVKNAGNLLGTITKTAATDNSNITVLIQNDEFSETGTTAADGSLKITGILPGTYKVTISSTGFVTQTIDDVVIRAAKDTSIGEKVLIANGGDIIGTVSINDGSSSIGSLITVTSQDKKYSYTTQASADGSFVIPNAYGAIYDITISKTGYAEVIQHNILVSAGQVTALGLIELSSSYGTVSGKVTDTSGNPIENAIVKIGDVSVFTGVDGMFTKTGVPVGNCEVSVSMEGYSTYDLAQAITVESSRTTGIGTVRLASVYGSITGTVTVNDGRSVSGIDVTATASDGTKTQVKTLSDGSYRIERLLPGTYSLSAKSDGYAVAERVAAVTADSTTEVDVLALTSLTGSLKVSVGYLDKADTVGITVTVYDPSSNKISEAVTTDSLSIVFTGIAVGSGYTVTAEAEGYAVSTRNGISVVSALETSLVIPGLSNKYGTVSGKVTEMNGNPIENAIVKIGDVSVFTGVDGSFTKTGVPVGNCEVSVSMEGYSTQNLAQMITVESSRTTSIGTIKLASIYGSITGTVTVNDGGSASGIDVTATSSDGTKTQVKTLSDGSYRIERLLPGTYSVSAKSDGYAVAERVAAVTADSTTEVDVLALTSLTGSLRVNVSYSDKADTAGITVTVYDNNGNNVAEAVTSDSLAISFTGIPVGTYTVTAEAESYATSTKAGVSVMSAIETSLAVPSLSNKYGTVSGKVTDTSGNPVENAIVKIGDVSVFTGVDGSFTKTGVPVGNCEVSVSMEGYSTQNLAQMITVESSRTTSIGTIKLASIYGSITGTVTVNDGKSVENINVSATSADGASIQVKTISDGTYCIQGLVPGDYTVSADADSYTGSSRSVAVSADNNVEIDVLALFSKYGKLSGRVVDSNGNPLSGVSIMIGDLEAVVTKADGTFIKDLLPVGLYSISITKEGFVDELLEDIEVQSFIETHLTDDIVMTPKMGTISGRVRIDGESDFSEIKVTVSSSGDGKDYSAFTEADGSFSISALPGNYNLIEFSHPCCNVQYYLDNVALFANGRVEVKPQGLNSTEYQIALSHNYGILYNESKSSSCTEQGYNKLRCWDCGKEITEYLDVLEHEFSLVDHLDPTCTEEGWRKYECSSCGQEFTEIDQALGHDWNKPVIIEAATCHSTGLQQVTCKTCGETENQTIAMLPHSWGDNGYHDGKIEYVCSVCDEVEYADDSTAILNISDWGSVSLKPSVDPSSVKTLIIPSEINGMTVTSVFEHTFQDCVNITKIVLPETLTSIESWAFAGCIGITEIDLPASLTRIGDQAFRGCTSLKSIVIPDGIEKIEYSTFYNCESLVSVTLPDSVTYLDRECFVGCGFDRFQIPETVDTLSCYVFMNCKNLKEILIPKSVKYVDDRPFWDCTSLQKIYVQSQTQPSGWITSWHDCCDAQIVWGYTGELHYTHTESTEWKTSSTYHWHECTECGEVMNMAKHTYQSAVTAQPTCTEAGTMTYTCSECGWSYTETIPALGHDYHSEITKQATCTEKGELKYSCSRCDSTYTEEIVSHHEYEEVITTAATCTTDGLKTLTCSICSDSKTEVIPATGHSYKETVVPATCTDDGTKIYKCEHCEDAYEEVIPATGHNYVASITKQATCEEDGIKTFTCSRCSDSYTETINAYGHYFTTSTIVQAATCHEAGIKSSKCFRCGKTVTEEIPKLEHNPVFAADEANHWTQCSLCGEILVSKAAHNYIEAEGDFVCADCGYSESSLYYQVDDNGVLTPKDKSVLPSVVRIPSNINGKAVTAIGDDAFRDCTNITTLYISEGIKKVGANAFWYCTNITSISLPSTLSEIGDSSFRGLEKLKDLVVPGSLRYLPSQSFSLCHDLQSIIIEDGVERIGPYALEEVFNNKLDHVEIPGSVTTIEGYAFRQCYIDEINYAGTIADWNNITIDQHWMHLSTIERIVCADGIIVIGDYDVTADGEFYVIKKDTIPSHFEIPSVINGIKVTKLADSAFDDCQTIESVVIPEGVVSIEAWGFYNCQNLKEISFPSTMKNIGHYALMGTQIETLYLPNGNLGNAIACCNSVKSITISNESSSAPIVGSCRNLEELVFLGTMSEWNRLPKEGGWCEKTLLKKVSCLDGDVEIPNIYINNGTLFCNNTSALLSVVEIPASFDGSAVKKISDNMFRGDTHIVSVVIPEGVKEVGASCFSECSNLVSVSLPSTITTIGSEAFQYCEKLESVKIPSGVTKIEPDTFSRCYSLSEVVIPNTVTTIGYGAFHSCPMKSIEIPDSVTSIGWVAFYDSKLTSLVIPDSVRYVDSEAFANSSLLESAVISGNLSSIPNKMFENCTNLSLIMFNGTVAKWNSLNKGSGWNEGVPATKVVCLDGEVNL